MANFQRKNPLVVVAVGGNALIREDQRGTIAEQTANVEECADHLYTMINNGYQIILTHGNGPQVGLIMLRDSYQGATIPPMPLFIYNAESQGQIGYQLMNAFTNKLSNNSSSDSIATVLTRVVVDENDPGFTTPTKPVGPFYHIEEIDILSKNLGFSYIEDSGRGYRKVVASPKPLEIIETDLIKDILSTGRSVIAAGGGGIPVIRKNNTLQGVDAVIDKDLTSALLAENLSADILIILTGIEQVAINFNKPNMQKLGKITVEEAKQYYEEGHFPQGSMGPKMAAAINFVEKSGGKAIITTLEKTTEALQGKAGTIVTP